MKSHYRYGILALLMAATSASSQQRTPSITVFKDRTCSCCKKWIAHLEANGFKTVVKEVDGTAPYQKQFHVPANLASCHTAVVGKYVIEGHVPAADLKRLLVAKPAGTVGLAVPGMPVGSPGMEMGDRSAEYAVVAFSATGSTRVFAKH